MGRGSRSWTKKVSMNGNIWKFVKLDLFQKLMSTNLKFRVFYCCLIFCLSANQPLNVCNSPLFPLNSWKIDLETFRSFLVGVFFHSGKSVRQWLDLLFFTSSLVTIIRGALTTFPCLSANFSPVEKRVCYILLFIYMYPASPDSIMVIFSWNKNFPLALAVAIIDTAVHHNIFILSLK